MTRPDDSTPSPERLDALLDGDPAAGPDERGLVDLVTELRADAEPAPERLADRVGAIASGAPGEAWFERLRKAIPALRLSGPRLAVVGGLGVVVLAVAVATPVILDRASEDAPTAFAAPEDGRGEDLLTERDLPGAAPAQRRAGESAASGGLAPGAPPPVGEPGRPQEITTSTRVAVDDVKALSVATRRAMAVARNLGGFTQSSDYSVPHGELGTSRLVLRVPNAKAGTAIARIDELGTVLSQDADLEDLSRKIEVGRSGLQRSASTLAELRRAAAANPDDPAIARRLAAAEERHRALVRSQRETLRRTRLATLNLTITTEGPADPPSGALTGSLTASGERLAGIGVGTIGVLVFLLPFALLALAVGWIVRWGQRRWRAELLSRR